MKITLQVDMPRRWRRVIGAGCVALLAFDLFLLLLARPTPAPPVIASASASALARVDGSTAALPAPQVLVPEPFAVELPAPSTKRRADEVQVCGGDWMKLSADSSAEADGQLAVPRLASVRAKVLSDMQGSPKEASRAAALMLTMMGNDAAHRSVALGMPGLCEGEACTTSPEVVAEVTGARNALATLAASTTDPRVYALAFAACGGGKLRDGTCQLLSAEQWSRLDPGNAAPWRYAFSAARLRNDRAAQDEALHRIATSQRSDLGITNVANAVLEAAPADDASQMAVYFVAIEAMGSGIALSLPSDASMGAACQTLALADANRRQTCDGVATLLTERSDNLLDRSIGASIGRRLEWPDDRVDRIRGENNAFQASGVLGLGEFNDFSCPALHKDIDALRRRVRLGEAGLLREWVAGSDKTPRDFVRVERARREAASSAAAAASASSALAPAAAPGTSVPGVDRG